MLTIYAPPPAKEGLHWHGKRLRFLSHQADVQQHVAGIFENETMSITLWNIHGAIHRKLDLGEMAHRYKLNVIAFHETSIFLEKIVLEYFAVYRKDKNTSGGRENNLREEEIEA